MDRLERHGSAKVAFIVLVAGLWARVGIAGIIFVALWSGIASDTVIRDLKSGDYAGALDGAFKWFAILAVIGVLTFVGMHWGVWLIHG